jgi:hypothetical protein
MLHRRLRVKDCGQGMEWDPTVDPTQRGYNRYEVDAHLERFDVEVKRLTTERDESITHAEDLG